jgi:hypothetical protein
MLSNKQVGKVRCIACTELIGDHSRRELGRCLFRIQGTMVAGKIEEPLATEDGKPKA